MIKKGHMQPKTETARADVTNFILFVMQNAVLLRIKKKIAFWNIAATTQRMCKFYINIHISLI
jgi:hypothetical protein